MSNRRTNLIAVLVLPIVLLLSFVTLSVANAGSRDDHGRTAITNGTITIRAFAYTVPAGGVTHGTIVKVVNKDSVAHTVTSNIAGRFNVSVPAHTTKQFRAPRAPGRYGFHCTFHAGMKSTLKVH
jgi:plastocyanin